MNENEPRIMISIVVTVVTGTTIKTNCPTEFLFLVVDLCVGEFAIFRKSEGLMGFAEVPLSITILESMKRELVTIVFDGSTTNLVGQ